MAKILGFFFYFFQVLVTITLATIIWPDYKINNLPGQPDNTPAFSQYAGYLDVTGGSIFFYFVEALDEPHSKPLLLWLGGGFSCSSLVGAMTGIGPFGVNPDGKTLYARNFTWNKEVNILFLEAPLSVGFSYSDATYETHIVGDVTTALESYTFLNFWLEMEIFDQYANSDLYIAGEGYAGYRVPELADLILERNKQPHSNKMQLKGIMIGNGYINMDTDNRGKYDFLWSHALISDDVYANLISRNCSEDCNFENIDIGLINQEDIYGPLCGVHSAFQRTYDPCEMKYVKAYLNIPQVQKALHANRTTLPSLIWEECNQQAVKVRSILVTPTNVLPVYQRLIASNLKILLYSGDADAIVPVLSTKYSICAMGLKVLKPWIPWNGEMDEVAGYRVVYEGLTFMTVHGAGHSVTQTQPARAFSLLKYILAMTTPEISTTPQISTSSSSWAHCVSDFTTYHHSTPPKSSPISLDSIPAAVSSAITPSLFSILPASLSSLFFMAHQMKIL